MLGKVRKGDGFVLGDWDKRTSGLGTAVAEVHRGRLRILVALTPGGVEGRGAVHLSPGQVGVTASLEAYYED